MHNFPLRKLAIALSMVLLCGCTAPGDPVDGHKAGSREPIGASRPVSPSGKTGAQPKPFKAAEAALSAEKITSARQASPSGGCASPRTTDEWLACSRAGKIKEPQPDVSGCANPRTTDEWLMCSNAGKIKEPPKDLSHCAKPRDSDEWLMCSNAGKIRQPKPDLSHCHQPRNSDEWLSCSRAGKLKK